MKQSVQGGHATEPRGGGVACNVAHSKSSKTKWSVWGVCWGSRKTWRNAQETRVHGKPTHAGRGGNVAGAVMWQGVAKP